MALNLERYSPPEPWPKVRDWFFEHVPNAERSFKDILEQGDAPGEVLDYCRVRIAYHERWMSDEAAKDRPITRDPVGPRVRLFDGPWIWPAPWHSNALPHVIEADIKDEERGDFVRYSALTWPTYEELIEKGDEEGLRRLAAAFYERINVERRGREMLVELINELRAKHAE